MPFLSEEYLRASLMEAQQRAEELYLQRAEAEA